MTKRIDLTGRRSGKLTVLEPGDLIRGVRHWLCRCDCGNVKQISGKNIRNDASKSCGCGQDEARDRWNAEQQRRALENPRESIQPPEYSVWINVKDRCFNPNNKTFQHYGGRGITVSAEWQSSFAAFLRDMGRRPDPTFEIDRINNDGNYENGNCRWVPHIVNANNKRNNRFVEFNGQRLTVSQWAREVGLTAATIVYRIRTGWSVEDALTLPAGSPPPRGQLVEHGGRSQTLRGWADETGLPPNLIRNRLNLGWSTTEALTTPYEAGRHTWRPGSKRTPKAE